MIKDPKTIELLLSFIGLVKAYMLSPHEVFKIAEINRDYLFIIDAYEQFESPEERNSGLLFFDDWLVETVKLLESDDAIRQPLSTSTANWSWSMSFRISILPNIVC